VHARIRWTLVGMVTCLVGVLIFGSARPRSTPTTAPRLLPVIDGSARPLSEDPSATLLPNPHRSLEFNALSKDDRSAIRPASHLTVLPFVVAPSMLDTNQPRIIEIRDGDVVWRVPSTDPIRLRQGEIVVRVTAEAGDGLTIQTTPEAKAGPPSARDGIFEISVTLPETSRNYELELKDGDRKSSPVRVRLPDSTLPQPQPSGASNNTFKPVDGFTDVRVYGRFLRVSGSSSDGPTPDRRDLEFVLFETGRPLVAETRQPEMIDLSVDQQGIWTATLRLPQLRRHFNGTILVRGRRDADHRYADREITFNVERDALTAEAPAIEQIERVATSGLAPNQRDDVWLVPHQEFSREGNHDTFRRKSAKQQPHRPVHEPPRSADSRCAYWSRIERLVGSRGQGRCRRGISS
jgi:hypothetical protein